jgi:hypothetical protein
MIHDLILDRIKEVRQQISAQCDHDVNKLVAHYVELDKTYPPERFFRSTESIPIKDTISVTLAEQLILAKLPLLSLKQQANVLGLMEKLLAP